MTNIDELYRDIKNKYLYTSIKVRSDFERAKCKEYYFNEHYKILSWNNFKNILEFTFLHFDIKLIDSYNDRFEKHYFQYVAPVEKYLEIIINNGWQWSKITKEKYNLIVYLKDFCDKFSAFINNSTNIPAKYFFPMEESFLKITYEFKYPRLILEGLDEYMSYERNNYLTEIELFAQARLGLEHFFYPKDSELSIYDYIIAFNISYYRRYLKWEDLSEQSIASTIPKGFYNCSYDIFETIINHAKNMVTNLSELEIDLKQLNWIKEIGEINEDKKLTKLYEFYNSFGHDWKTDIFDVFKLFMNLLEGIIKHLYNIVDLEWELAAEKSEVIRHKIITGNEVGNLYNSIVNELNLAKSKYANIIHTRITLKEISETTIQTSEILNDNHKYVYEKVMNALKHLFDIANIFNELYNTKDELKNQHLNYLLLNPEDWCGKPVYAMLKYNSELFLIICGFFKEKNIEIKINNYDNLKRQIKDIKKELSRITDSNNFIGEYLEKLKMSLNK